jgi:hypothetical protein
MEFTVRPVITQAMPDPLRHRYADSIAHKTPALPSILSIRDGRKRPPSGETLEQFSPFDRRDKNGATTREPNRWRSGDAETRPWFQRRHRVDCPAEATVTLGPVKPAGVIPIGQGLRFAGILCQQDGTRVSRSGRNQDYPSPPLRQSERASIQNAISP